MEARCLPLQEKPDLFFLVLSSLFSILSVTTHRIQRRHFPQETDTLKIQFSAGRHCLGLFLRKMFSYKYERLCKGNRIVKGNGVEGLEPDAC